MLFGKRCPRCGRRTRSSIKGVQVNGTEMFRAGICQHCRTAFVRGLRVACSVIGAELINHGDTAFGEWSLSTGKCPLWCHSWEGDPCNCQPCYPADCDDDCPGPPHGVTPTAPAVWFESYKVRRPFAKPAL